MTTNAVMPTEYTVSNLGLNGDYARVSITQPNYAGQIEIAPGLLIPIQKMPNRFYRWMNKIFFGYKYYDWRGWAN